MFNSPDFETLIKLVQHNRKKHRQYNKNCTKDIDFLIKNIDKTIDELEKDQDNSYTMEIETPETKSKNQNSDAAHKLIKNLATTITKKKIMQSRTTAHKQSYAFLSKLGKTVEKNFKYSNDIENIFSKDLDKNLINQLIFNHLI
jgi:hypothetical protein